MEKTLQISLSPQKEIGIMPVSLLQIMKIIEGTMPLTPFGWLNYLNSKEGQKRLKKIINLKK